MIDGKFGANLVVEHGEARHDEGDQENEEAEDQRDQQGGVDERGLQLLAEGERDTLEGKITAQNVFQIAASFACQQRRRIDEWESALRFEGAEMDSPVRTRAATFSNCAENAGFFWPFASISSEPRIGSPARTRVRNCWLKIINVSSLAFFRLHR